MERSFRRRLLGVNIDHVATLRQARQTTYPNVIAAAHIAESAGAERIIAHLREDRRHIQDSDLYLLRDTLTVPLNMEMSINPGVVKVAEDVKPYMATLVPERREELTTEGGLDAVSNMKELESVVEKLSKKGIIISLFIDAEFRMIKAAQKLGVQYVEFHTGTYCNAVTEKDRYDELKKLREIIDIAIDNNLRVNVGHGINYHNVGPLADIDSIEEFNIGHSIISASIIEGLATAVSRMRSLIKA